MATSFWDEGVTFLFGFNRESLTINNLNAVISVSLEVLKTKICIYFQNLTLYNLHSFVRTRIDALNIKFGVYLQNLKNKNLNTAIQAALDAIDIWLGCIRYIFDFLNPLSGNLSYKAMCDFLVTDFGAKLYLIGMTIFGFFGFSANFLDDREKWSLGGITDAYWPYLRDSFKALKWTFRGCRNLLLIFEKMNWVDWRPMIAPIGVFFGLAAALNRWSLREIVEERKRNKKFNKSFQKHAKNFQAVYVELDEQPDEIYLNLFYKKSIICIKNKLYQVVDGQLNLLKEVDELRLKKRYDLYDAFLNQSEISQKIGQMTISFQEQMNLRKAYLEEINLDRLLKAPVFQANEHWYALRSVINGIFNSPYYFLGVLFMISLPQHYFIWGLIICSVFCLLNIAAEYIQELEYQRELDITASKARMTLLKRVVSLEADFHKMNQQNYTLDRQNHYITLFNQEQERLKKLLVLDAWYLSVQGLRNGLLCYGIINGCLNTVASIAYLRHWDFMTPGLFSASIWLGIALVILGILYTFYNAYFSSQIPATSQIPEQRLDEPHFTADAWRCIHAQNVILPTPNAWISPQCEVLRQGLTGIKKALKMLQINAEIFKVFSPEYHPEVMYIYPVTCLFYMIEFCCKGIRGMVQSDDAFQKTTLWSILTIFDKKGPEVVETENDDECVNSIFMQAV